MGQPGALLLLDRTLLLVACWLLEGTPLEPTELPPPPLLLVGPTELLPPCALELNGSVVTWLLDLGNVMPELSLPPPSAPPPPSL